MVKLIPQDGARYILRQPEVRANEVRSRPEPRPLLPQAVRGAPEYLADPQQFLSFVEFQLEDDPGRVLASLEHYANDLAAQSGAPVQQQRAVENGRVPTARFTEVAEPLGADVARTRLATLGQLLTTGLFKSGLTFVGLAPVDIASVYGAARAANVPLGKILCRENGDDGEPRRLLTELAPPQQFGFTGGTLPVKGITPFSSSQAVVDYVKGTTRAGQSLDFKIAAPLQRFVQGKLFAANLNNFNLDQVADLLRAFASGNRGSTVAAFRQLALTTPDIVPRLQRVLRNYDERALDYARGIPTLQRATRVISLLFGADIGLRKVQLAAMTADLVGKSNRLGALMTNRMRCTNTVSSR